MGCCASTQAGDDDRHPSSAVAPTTQQPTILLTSPTSPSTSTPSRAQTPRPLQLHSPSRSSASLRRPYSSSSSSNHTPRLNLPSSERYNAPLTIPSTWTSTNKTWSPNQLRCERQEFFDTRVTGRPEIWSALQNVCELARGGDVTTAQGILDAAGITLPAGNLVDGCYDEAGNLYRLPEVVVSDPVNMRAHAADGEEEVMADRSRHSHNIDGETMIGVPVSKNAAATGDEKVLQLYGENRNVGHEDEVEMMSDRQRGDLKGKGSERDAVKVRCRLSDRGGPDVVIAMGKTQHVAALARRVQAEGNVSPTLHIRMAYLGKILNEEDTLEAQGWKEGHVINALVVGGGSSGVSQS